MTFVTCTCPPCQKHTFKDSKGRSINGKRVHHNTRSAHAKKEIELRSRTVPVCPAVITIPIVDTQLPHSGQSSGSVVEPTAVSPVRLVELAWTLAAWLHLACGLSRDASIQALKIIFMLISASFRLGATLRSAEAHDILQAQTTMSTVVACLSLEPELRRQLCCSKCFKIYEHSDNKPCQISTCTYKESTGSRACGAHLFTMRNLGGHALVRVPVRQLTTQDFDSWLTSFLSWPDVEIAIGQSYHAPPYVPGQTMHDIWDSPAWRSLGDFSTTPSNLTFSYYIDWFNPFLNKISGKHVSCGAIIMFCLNLPPELRHRPENIYVAAMTPPDREPDFVTISHITNPVINQLIPFYAGKVIATASHPLGTLIRVAVLPLIGDIPAVRKMGGFGSHSAEVFCTACECRLSNLESLDAWPFKSGPETRRRAQQWLDAPTKVERAALAKEHGVRHTPLHRLTYRDPIVHTLLGIMHAWLEGVIQHHIRMLWGVGGIVAGMASLNESATQYPAGEEEDPSESDASMDVDSDASTTRKPGKKPAAAKAPPRPSIFSKTQLQHIRACITDIILPSWVERPPTNLGEKRHGRLKADNWLVLITVILPMAMVDMWYQSKVARDLALLRNFEILCFCTHLACSYSTSNAQADLFDHWYRQYRQGIKDLFPDVKSRPNHHFASHIGDMLKFWGPVIVLCEFAYERINGLLQRIKTNNHRWDLDFTMIQQVCRRAKLFARMDATMGDSETSAEERCALELLRPSNTPSTPSIDLSKSVMLDKLTYGSILERLQAQDRSFISHRLVNPEDPSINFANVVTSSAVPALHFEHKGRTFAVESEHTGNGSVVFMQPDGRLQSGVISKVWLKKVRGCVRTFISLVPHEDLNSDDEHLNPWSYYAGFRNRLYYADSQQPAVVVEPDQLVSHAPQRFRPAGWYGIKRATRIVHMDLNRGRR